MNERENNLPADGSGYDKCDPRWLRGAGGFLGCAFFLALLVLASGCGNRYIDSPVVAPDAEIRNTDEAQVLVGMIQDYQEALGRRNTAAIRAMVSSQYYENAGTTDTTEDDYGLDGLYKVLEMVEEHAREVRVEFQVRELEIDERRGRAQVVYEYVYTVLYQVGDEERWDVARDVNRMDFSNEDGVWRITGGL